MQQSKIRWIVRWVLAAVGVAVISGCAADPRFKTGTSWIVENEVQKAKLQAQGFPQYTDGF